MIDRYDITPVGLVQEKSGTLCQYSDIEPLLDELETLRNPQSCKPRDTRDWQFVVRFMLRHLESCVGRRLRSIQRVFCLSLNALSFILGVPVEDLKKLTKKKPIPPDRQPALAAALGVPVTHIRNNSLSLARIAAEFCEAHPIDTGEWENKIKYQILTGRHDNATQQPQHTPAHQLHATAQDSGRGITGVCPAPENPQKPPTTPPPRMTSKKNKKRARNTRRKTRK